MSLLLSFSSHSCSHPSINLRAPPAVLIPLRTSVHHRGARCSVLDSELVCWRMEHGIWSWTFLVPRSLISPGPCPASNQVQDQSSPKSIKSHQDKSKMESKSSRPFESTIQCQPFNIKVNHSISNKIKSYQIKSSPSPSPQVVQKGSGQGSGTKGRGARKRMCARAGRKGTGDGGCTHDATRRVRV